MRPFWMITWFQLFGLVSAQNFVRNLRYSGSFAVAPVKKYFGYFRWFPWVLVYQKLVYRSDQKQLEKCLKNPRKNQLHNPKCFASSRPRGQRMKNDPAKCSLSSTVTATANKRIIIVIFLRFAIRHVRQVKMMCSQTPIPPLAHRTLTRSPRKMMIQNHASNGHPKYLGATQTGSSLTEIMLFVNVSIYRPVCVSNKKYV